MAKYDAELYWARGSREWRWQITDRRGDLAVFGSSPWRWRARRQMMAAITDLKVQEAEDTRNAARGISLEVEI